MTRWILVSLFKMVLIAALEISAFVVTGFNFFSLPSHYNFVTLC